MEMFYDDNFECFEVGTNNNFYEERVWNIYYDNKYDLIYLFLGKIKQLRGERINRFEDRTGSKQTTSCFRRSRGGINFENCSSNEQADSP